MTDEQLIALATMQSVLILYLWVRGLVFTSTLNWRHDDWRYTRRVILTFLNPLIWTKNQWLQELAKGRPQQLNEALAAAKLCGIRSTSTGLLVFMFVQGMWCRLPVRESAPIELKNGVTDTLIRWYREDRSLPCRKTN